MDDPLPVLVQRVLSGDVDAFAVMMARFRPRFGRYALRMVGNREDAEEALQDAFVRIYRNLGTCRDPARLEGWAFRVLVNRCRSTLARTRREPRAIPADAAEPAGVDHPADTAAWREEIGRALGRLPREQREAFLLRHVEGFSYGEMAAMTGAGVSALKMRVLRACETLRAELDGATRDD